MKTKIYGASDDLIEIEGEINNEFNYYEVGEDQESGALLVFSDGTILDVTYGKGDLAVWQVVIIKQGDLFDKLDVCNDEDAELYSDVAHFKSGLKWVIFSSKWERVKK